MRTRSFTMCSSALLILAAARAYGYEESTHQAITRRAIDAARVPLEERLRGYSVASLDDTIDISPSRAASPPCVDPYGTNKASDWIVRGSCEEDHEGLDDGTVQYRIVNHFHDPLRPLVQGGLTPDPHVPQTIAPIVRQALLNAGLVWTPPSLTGQSSLVWGAFMTPAPPPAVDQEPAFGDYWNMSWGDARQYLYLSLVLRAPAERRGQLALALKALGHELHLLQDASVPSHVRNDWHITIAKDARLRAAFASQGSIFHADTFGHRFMALPDQLAWIAGAPVVYPEGSGSLSFRKLMDQDAYDGQNPSVTVAGPIGLSEYTQANFYSDDTFGSYPEPLHSQGPVTIEHVTLQSGQVVSVPYASLPRAGIAHLGRKSFLGVIFPGAAPATLNDPLVHADYEAALVPRAIGYSAALIEEFFRGTVDVTSTTVDGLTISNPMDESLEGDFELYYDELSGQRTLVARWPRVSLASGAQVEESFAVPSGAREPGKYVLVFKGRLGDEQNSVFGLVVHTQCGDGLTWNDTVQACVDACGCPPEEARNTQGQCVPAAHLHLLAQGRGDPVGEMFPEGCGLDCGPDCVDYRFPIGTEVQFSTSPNFGAFFSSFSGGCIDGHEGSIMAEMDSDKTCTVAFEEGKHLHMQATGSGSGSLSVDPGENGYWVDSCGDRCTDYILKAGTSVSAGAVASVGSTFVGWSGACSGFRHDTTVLISGDQSCSGEFGPGGSELTCNGDFSTEVGFYWCDPYFGGPCGVYTIHAYIFQADDAELNWNPGHSAKYTAGGIYARLNYSDRDYEAPIPLESIRITPDPDYSPETGYWDNQILPTITITYRLRDSGADNVVVVPSCF